MDDRVKSIVRDAIIKLIHDTASPASIAKSMQVHAAKTHFVPTKYRVLGGLLQSLNIKFGGALQDIGLRCEIFAPVALRRGVWRLPTPHDLSGG